MLVTALKASIALAVLPVPRTNPIGGVTDSRRTGRRGLIFVGTGLSLSLARGRDVSEVAAAASTAAAGFVVEITELWGHRVFALSRGVNAGIKLGWGPSCQP